MALARAAPATALLELLRNSRREVSSDVEEEFAFMILKVQWFDLVASTLADEEHFPDPEPFGKNGSRRLSAARIQVALRGCGHFLDAWLLQTDPSYGPAERSLLPVELFDDALEDVFGRLHDADLP